MRHLITTPTAERAAYLANLREQVLAGTYRPDLDVIALRMVHSGRLQRPMSKRCDPFPAAELIARLSPRGTAMPRA
ncbi:MAG: flagellar biosynthesis anti-sigma factor FlgM [Deltaproteobacteria bacterium]|nr:flagellar biosynthesis anti-sigma factor FlgM [Deltaproteobacteria bacterium]